MTAATDRLDGRRLLILSPRDIGHPQAGDEERYLHQIARRWVMRGARVSWAATRTPHSSARDEIDGIEMIRSGGRLGRYPRTPSFDAIVDSTGRPPFAITGRRVPVVPVVHNVHRLTNPDRSHTSDAITRFLSGPVARRSSDDRAIVV
ncbi:MAG TPA: glycosyltransferase family 1 protein, partial [Pseudonocardiaceae bacterium]|nr:glycosyltransferase family 1 protein [Pseudonocardiaceae bacterium]